MKRITLFILTLMLVSNTLNAQSGKAPVLVLFHSENGGTYQLAQQIAKGIENQGAHAVIKRIPTIQPNEKWAQIPLATVAELPEYAGIAFGSPVHFGNMSADMRLFLDGTVDLWTKRALEGIPATVFMSAGSGAGNELAILSFWNTLAVHGMVLVPTGIMGTATMNKNIAQGNTVLGTTSLVSMPGSVRPSESELHFAELQGVALAKIAMALFSSRTIQKAMTDDKTTVKEVTVEDRLKASQLSIPKVPAPAGNYKPYSRSGNLIFINQVALKDGKVLHPGVVGKDITEEEAKKAVEQTMLNVIAVLKDATGGDLNRVRQCVQLTGFFNTSSGYTQHAALMNIASDLTVTVFGEKGKHARATLGASSLPVNSSVEIQAVFEIE